MSLRSEFSVECAVCDNHSTVEILEHSLANLLSLSTFLLHVDYQLMEKMGEGTFSEVLKCQSLLDGKFYACKKMKQRYRRYVHVYVIPQLS